MFNYEFILRLIFKYPGCIYDFLLIKSYLEMCIWGMGRDSEIWKLQGKDQFLDQY